jgi:ligand-binding sensor domain-containing protein/two-component sensor histidine kinase
VRCSPSQSPRGWWAGVPLALAGLVGALLLQTRAAAQTPSLHETLGDLWRWRTIQRDDVPPGFHGVSTLPDGTLAVADDHGIWLWDGLRWSLVPGSDQLDGVQASRILELGDAFVIQGHDHVMLVDPAAEPAVTVLLEDSAALPFSLAVRAPGGAVHLGVGNEIQAVTREGLATVMPGPPGAAQITGLAYDRGGQAWCTTEMGIHRLVDGAWVHEYEREDALASAMLGNIQVLADRIVFLPYSFSRIDSGLTWNGTEIVALGPADAAGVLRDAVATPDGEVLVAIGHAGLRLLTDDTWSHPDLPPGFTQSIDHMAFTDEGRLITITKKRALLLHDYTSQRWELVDDYPEGLSPIVNTLHPSRRGGFWLGTNEGIARYHDGAFHDLVLDRGEGGPPLFGITAIYEDDDGTLWLGAGGDLNGILRHDFETWELVGCPPGVGPAGVHAIDSGPDGSLWFSLLSLDRHKWNRGGLLLLRDGRLEVQYWMDGGPMGRAYGVTYDQTGDPWVGQRGLLGRQTNRGWEIIPGVPFDEPLEGTFCMFNDSHGTLWAGHSVWDSGVARLPAGSPATAWEHMHGPVWDRVGAGSFAETPDGRLWMASDVGLFQFRDGACLEVPTEGVVSESAFWPLLEDPNGDGLWIGSLGSGLLRLRPDDLQPPESSLLTEPARPSGDSAHGVRRIDWRTVDAWGSSPRSSLRHRTRVDGAEWSAWSPAGAESTLTTGDLSVGEHTVEIQGIDVDGNREEPPLLVPFTIQPPGAGGWSDPPMITAATLLLASVATLAWVVVRRRREVRVEMRARNELTARLRELADRLLSTRDEERLALSRDLHDDLGQLLTATCMHLEHATETGPGEQHESALARAHAAAVKSLHSMRELVARVRPPAIEHMGLEGAVRGAIEDFAASTGLEVTSELQLDGEEVPRSAAESIWRILKEGLTNVARHAQAGRIEVFLSATPEALHLRLRDDGRGFRPTRRPASGVGLLGMRERAESLGGSFDLDSRPGAGTQLSVSIPIEHGSKHEEVRGT